MALAKARIHIVGKSSNDDIVVLFNPAEYSLDLSNDYAEKPAAGAGEAKPQYTGGRTPTLSMELYFDTYTDGGGSNVSTETSKVALLLGIDDKDPPDVEFQWGEFAFYGVVEKVSQRFTMFREDGVPVRAKLSVTFKGKKPLSQQLKISRQASSDNTKKRTVTADTSIWHLAAKEFGDPRQWKSIARHNRIDDPGAIRPGTALIVPPLDLERARGAS